MKYFFFLIFSCSLIFCQSPSVGEELESRIKYVSGEENLIGYLTLEKDRSIDQSTFIKFKFALEYFRKKGVRFVLLKLNTPGGEVFAAQKICRLLQELDIQYDIPVVAFIDNWAISAGAMLAYSSRFIASTPQSSMGAAEPLTVGTEGAKTASEKINSALRSEFSNLARFYGRNPLLAQAMVDKSIVLVFRRGTIVKLNNDKEITSSDTVITQEGKLLTLDGQQLIDWGVADFQVPFQKSIGDLSQESEKGFFSFENSPLFSYPFFSKMKEAKLITYTDWKINLFSFLSHPMISSLLVMGLMIGFYIEISTPGFGIFGSIGLICLSLILLSSFSVYAVNWLEIILLAVGAALLLLEIFVIPGFGVAGIVGTILFVVGLFALMLPNLRGLTFSFNFDQLNLEALDILYHLAWFCGAFILAFICILLLSKYALPTLFSYSPIISRGSQDKELGYTSGPRKESLPSLGEKGIAYSSLRPSGKVLINGEVYDALAESGFIEKEEEIKVMSIRANRLIVRKI